MSERGRTARARPTSPSAGDEWLLRTPLLTDLYELTMLHAYGAGGMQQTAAFEFFVRRLPATRGFLVACGLEVLLAHLEQVRFERDDIEWLASTGRYDAAFLESLARWRFTGDVDAMPEGTLFFAHEPTVRVVAPLPQAQLVESRLINLLHLSTLVASKAARCVLAAPGKRLVDFGMRRAHGYEAALHAARAAWLAGFDGTATVLAERRFGVPAFGTMAHSFVQAHDSEAQAFEAFARAERDNVVLLIDTYDTLAGARVVVDLAPRLRAAGTPVRAVRLDSGDLLELSRGVRAILDAGGCEEVSIFASGGLDEYALRDLLAAGAPIDGFGVGTSLDVSADAPYLDCVYKLQEYAGLARRKRSTGKATWPGRKQVYRRCNDGGRIAGDVLTVDGDPQPGTPLLVPVMRNGRRLAPPEPAETTRERVRAGLATLPDGLRRLRRPASAKVEVSAALRALADEVDRRFG